MRSLRDKSFLVLFAFVFISTSVELYRVCPKLKTENKFSCCQKSEYIQIFRTSDWWKWDSSHDQAHDTFFKFDFSFFFFFFPVFFWKRNTCHKTKYVHTQERHTVPSDLCCRSFSGQDLFFNLNFFQRISRIFHWL